MASPPAIYISEITLRCGSQTRIVDVIGPTSSAAIRKIEKFDARAHGRNCYIETVKLVKRGRGAGLSGARKPRRRRRR